MKLFKSLLLASATGLVAVSGASAADLGAKKPSPVEFVKACYNPLWGTSGGFTIPGTQTCLRIGGQARFDYGYGQPFARNASLSGFRGGGNIFLDAITPSEFGNVRAFIQYSQLYRTGGQRSGSSFRFGQSADSNTVGGFGSAGASDFSGSSGFIQFAGFTFGRTSSFFGTLGRAPEIIGNQIGNFIGNVNMAAYTASLGNGFLATIAIEDPTTRRNGLATVNALGTVLTATPNAGFRTPNLVGALRLDQAWGSAEVSGLLTEIRAGNLTGGPFVAGPGIFGTPTQLANSKLGFAISGGLKINVPQLAAGDALYLGAVYADGVTGSTYGNIFAGALSTSTVGGATLNAHDGVISPLTGNIRTTRSYGFNAGFQHFWTPTFATTISGAYGEIDIPLTANTVGDTRFYGVGLLNSYTPVRGLQFALDTIYIHLDPRGRQIDANRGAPFTKSQDGAFAARFRVTRDF
ncbi:MAG: porin [Beijerinckiaceae bacterium]